MSKRHNVILVTRYESVKKQFSGYNKIIKEQFDENAVKSNKLQFLQDIVFDTVSNKACYDTIDESVKDKRIKNNDCYPRN